MSSGEVRKVSRQDIQLVQNLIERCLQLYMSQKEVVSTLLHQAKIEPGFTELVWQKLEEENQEFFRAYHFRLILKDQILRFNELLERQVELMRQICPTEVASIPISNGSQVPSMCQNSACHPREHVGPALKSENLQPHLHFSVPNLYINGASSLQPSLQSAVNMPSHARRVNVSSNVLLDQTPNFGMVERLDGGMMKLKAEVGYSGNSGFMFGSDNNVLDTRPIIGDASVSSFSNVESTTQPLNETVLDPDAPSFGFLRQIPRNFSLSDLSADFSNSSDILESYSRSPFLATDADHFIDPHGRGEQQVCRLDKVSVRCK